MEKNISVKNSKGIIVGNNNKQTIVHNSKDKSFEIPINDNLDFLVLLGRKILKKIGKNNFLIVDGLGSILFLGLIVFSVFRFLNSVGTGKFLNIWFYLIVISTLILVFFVSFLSLFQTRTCEKCNKNFAYREHKPQKHLKKGHYRNKIYHNIKQFLKCDYCGHEYEHVYIDEEEISNKGGEIDYGF